MYFPKWKSNGCYLKDGVLPEDYLLDTEMSKEEAISYILNDIKTFEGTWNHQKKLKEAIEILIQSNETKDK